MFTGFKLNRNALLYPFWFFIRRYLVILVLTIATSSTLLQIHFYMLLTCYIVYYLASFKPYYEPK